MLWPAISPTESSENKEELLLNKSPKMKAAMATKTNTTTQVPILLLNVPINAISQILKTANLTPFVD
jgi:hypothetical protein